jgi:putative acetyltransferase
MMGSGMRLLAASRSSGEPVHRETPNHRGVHIRAETAEDYAGITQVNRSAFGGDDEARLVDLLRQGIDVIASLVAVAPSGEVVGHIMFTRAAIVAPDAGVQVASLAPMAVAPSWQRQGVGSKLVEQGLGVCREAGYEAVIVVGHPSYYPRFGFTHAVVRHLTNLFAASEAFMGLEFVPGALVQLDTGQVVYPEAFNQL